MLKNKISKVDSTKTMGKNKQNFIVFMAKLIFLAIIN